MKRVAILKTVSELKLSVIVPAFNEEKYIGRCLESIIEEAGDDVYEIIVVDNASTDRTSQIAKKYKGVKVVRENRKGLTKARQAGFLAAKGDILAYIDADSIVNRGWFHRVRKEFEKNPKLVCLSSPYSLYDASKWKRVATWAYWNLLGYPIYKFLIQYMVQGTNIAIKRSVLLKIGGFDESIEFYGEDTDIARRLNRIGKVKFLRRPLVASSARRMDAEGWLKMGFKYGFNFISEIVLRKPLDKQYQDHR